MRLPNLELCCVSVLNFISIQYQLQELKIRPCPIIFASFSGGPKACMYKVLQVSIILVGLEKVYISCLFQLHNVS